MRVYYVSTSLRKQSENFHERQTGYDAQATTISSCGEALTRLIGTSPPSKIQSKEADIFEKSLYASVRKPCSNRFGQPAPLQNVLGCIGRQAKSRTIRVPRECLRRWMRMHHEHFFLKAGAHPLYKDLAAVIRLSVQARQHSPMQVAASKISPLSQDFENRATARKQGIVGRLPKSGTAKSPMNFARFCMVPLLVLKCHKYVDLCK